MASFSLGAVWEDTVVYIRRESGVLIPVALAIFGPAQLMLGYAMAGMDPAGLSGERGAHNLLILPAMLLVLFGNMAVSVIVLTPGISVREALTRSLSRFPLAIGTVMLLAAGFFAIVIVAAIIGSIVAVVAGAGAQATGGIAASLATVLTIPALFIAVRLLLMSPVLAVERLGAVDSIRRIWALGRGKVLRFAAIFLLMLLVGTLFAVLEQFVLGSLFKIVGLATGPGELLTALQMVANAAIESLVSMAIAVFLAMTYRRVLEA